MKYYSKAWLYYTPSLMSTMCLIFNTEPNIYANVKSFILYTVRVYRVDNI